MIKKTSLFLVIFSLFFALSCGKDNSTPEVKRGVAPVADSEIAVIDTDYGTIKIELYSNIAPKHVERFKELAREGYYNGIAFHRVNQTVVQAGNSYTKPGAQAVPGQEGKSDKPNVEAEFSDIKYDAGIVGAARLGNDFHSFNSQFFITLNRAQGFDEKYSVFGKVIEGMNNVTTIANAPREGERPNPPIRIKSVTIQPK